MVVVVVVVAPPPMFLVTVVFYCLRVPLPLRFCTSAARDLEAAVLAIKVEPDLVFVTVVSEVVLFCYRYW